MAATKRTKEGRATGTPHVTCVALLRGVNVSGHNRVPMAELAALCERIGCKDVRTYIQSGNVVLSTPSRSVEGLATKLAAAIEHELGVRAPVVLRSAGELGDVVKHNPFLAEGEDPKRLHVAFLQDDPAPTAKKALDPGRSPPDRFMLRGRELYLCLPNGMARTRLTSDYLDRTLGTVCTVRNWNTVLALRDLAQV